MRPASQVQETVPSRKVATENSRRPTRNSRRPASTPRRASSISSRPQSTSRRPPPRAKRPTPTIVSTPSPIFQRKSLDRDPWSSTRGNQGRRNDNLDEVHDIPTCTGNIKYDLKLCRYTDLIHHLKTFYENIKTAEVTSIEELLTEKMVNGLGRVALQTKKAIYCLDYLNTQMLHLCTEAREYERVDRDIKVEKIVRALEHFQSEYRFEMYPVGSEEWNFVKRPENKTKFVKLSDFVQTMELVLCRI
ncbi:hypothetical protein CAEBREN_23089 [Caenorhabditis brenneri]|uniref:Uncharacterized protein n=1 Tax=Caenorhabditis brenneri TaxID=135651 RepID=G0MZK6_CAEBE|nr:hypothetical protein CAEBREN_23089 [Caenorhabditis brenneri]